MAATKTAESGIEFALGRRDAGLAEDAVSQRRERDTGNDSDKVVGTGAWHRSAPAVERRTTEPEHSTCMLFRQVGISLDSTLIR